MAVKLDNNEEYKLTNAELAWMYKTALKQDIKYLKHLQNRSIRYALLSYACFGLSSYLSGNNLSEYINKQEDETLIYFLIMTGLAFWNNYNGVKCFEEVMKNHKDIKIIKTVLKEFKKIENLPLPIPDETINALKEAYDNSKMLVRKKKIIYK